MKYYAYLSGRDLLVADDTIGRIELKDFLFGDDDTDEADRALALAHWNRTGPWEPIHRSVNVLTAEVNRIK